MFKEFMKKIMNIGEETNNKKKIENLFFLIVLLIITIVIINSILNKDKKDNNENVKDNSKTLANSITQGENNSSNSDELQTKLENILSTIKGVGDVKVFISYSESSDTIAMYDEKTTVNSTEETDSAGGLRNTTSTETQKNVIFSEEDGSQVPVTEKVVMPKIEGAVVTANGAGNAVVKTNIINAIKSATGLSIDKIQVFEMEE